jgi:DNA-directed RNA polymerase specialized sigma24 family protein
MNPETLEPLLDKLCRGDMAAARQVFLTCEAYLLRVVRRQLPSRLQAKFDSIDIVQSVWADMLRGYRAGAWHFADVRHFQAFLVQVTRNRFNDKFRKHRLALEREQCLDGVHTSEMPACFEPGAPEVAQAEELWEQMLKLCAPEHHELLLLKRQGVPMDTMVARTGLHPGSIRRIFRNLARKLALQG